jgi:tetratricopeptide (TPR) repeat protein
MKRVDDKKQGHFRRWMMIPIIRGIAAVMAVLIVWCVPAFSAPTVVTADGKYVMGDLDSKKDAKTLALMEAKRIALEKAGTYIESISEVRNYQLTKDQINSLAAGIMSVEVLKEDWKMFGESMVLLISIRATIDTSNLKTRVEAMQDVQGSVSNKEVQTQIAALQKELAEMKAQQATMKEKAAPKPEIKERHDGIMKKMSALEYLEDGHAALRGERWNAAIEAYRQVLAVDPEQADAYGGISIALQRTGQHEKALEAATMGLKLNPQKPLSHTAMARILYDRGKYNSALEFINKAIELSVEAPRYYIFRGEIYIKLRNRQMALTDFIRACEMGLPRACRRADMVKQRMGGMQKPDERASPAGPGKMPPKLPPPHRGE